MKTNSMVAYLRDSGGDNQDLSVAQQRQALEEWASSHNVVITRWFIDEARTGSTTHRRINFLKMIEYFRQPVVEETGVLVWSYSRFSRNATDSAYYTAALEMSGYKLVSITDDVPEGPNGIIFKSLQYWKDATFLLDTSINAKRGVNQLLQNHGALGGVPPKGFKREESIIGKHRDGSIHRIARWVPDPETWEICKIAWQLRAEGKTYRQINDVVHLFGSKNSYSTFFKNRLYVGELVFGDTIIVDYVEPMIDRHTWELVQNMASKRDRMKTNSKDHPRRLAGRFILSGLLHCAQCGAPMNGEDVLLADHPYYYYRCSRAGRRNDCHAIRIPKEAIELAVMEKLDAYVLDPNQVIIRQKQILAKAGQANTERNTIKRGLKDELNKRNSEIRNIMDVIKATGTNSVSLLGELSSLEKEVAWIQQKITDLCTQEESEAAISPEEAAQLAQQLRERMQKEDPAELRQICRAMIHRVEAEKVGRSVQGLIQFYNVPTNSGSGENENFMSTSLCPHLESTFTHKIFQIAFKVPILRKPYTRKLK